MILSTNFCVSFIEKKYSLTFNVLANFYFATIFLQTIFVLLIFFIPPIRDFLVDMQRVGERELLIVSSHMEDQNRFIGFGLMFYTASFFYGAALIFISYLLRENEGANKRVLFCLFLLFSLVGIGLSRSTMIGLILSIVFYFVGSKINYSFIKRIFLFLIACCSIVLGIIMLFKLFPTLDDQFGALIKNSFEVFINLFTSSELKSDSAEGTFAMFYLPLQEWTYFFGTGYYEQYTAIGDYRYSDIGYLRLLYYFGLLGVVLFFLFEIQILNICFYKKGYKFIFWPLLFLLILTNVKGLTTLAVIALLFINIKPKLR